MFISSAYRCAIRSNGRLTLGIVRRVARPLVCIPTYNEASNILALIEEVHVAAPDADVLVIDDSSPDGTGELVRDRMLKDARLDAMARPAKLGLGTAYMAGFAFALQHGYPTTLTMDADFSHPPELIPALIAAVDEGVNLSIGSRYVPVTGRRFCCPSVCSASMACSAPCTRPRSPPPSGVPAWAGSWSPKPPSSPSSWSAAGAGW